MIGLDATKFKTITIHHWESRENRKKLFDDFMAQRGLDPLLPDNWYDVFAEDLCQVKGGYAVLNFYNYSLVAASSDIYPDIGLEEHKFLSVLKNYWAVGENRRKFYDNLAKGKNFDPLDPKKWYIISRADVLKIWGGSSVLSYHEDSFVKSLVELYPELGLKPKKFRFGTGNDIRKCMPVIAAK